MLYLIHFSEPIGTEKHSAQHYLGFVEGDQQSVQARLEEHKAGWGAKILHHCNQRQIHYEVVRTLPGDRNRERQLKKGKNISRLCPICSKSKK